MSSHPALASRGLSASIEEQERARVVHDYAAGRLGRQEAMSALGTDYLGLLDALADHGLAVPVLPDEEIERMADTFVRLMDETEPTRADAEPAAG